MIIKIIAEDVTELFDSRTFSFRQKNNEPDWIQFQFDYLDSTFQWVERQKPVWVYVTDRGKTVEKLEFLINE